MRSRKRVEICAIGRLTQTNTRPPEWIFALHNNFAHCLYCLSSGVGRHVPSVLKWIISGDSSEREAPIHRASYNGRAKEINQRNIS